MTPLMSSYVVPRCVRELSLVNGDSDIAATTSVRSKNINIVHNLLFLIYLRHLPAFLLLYSGWKLRDNGQRDLNLSSGSYSP